jgi:hypothetical protein
VANYRVSKNKKQQKNTRIKEKKTNKKVNQLRLFEFKNRFLKIGISFQISLAAEPHLAEGQ